MTGGNSLNRLASDIAIRAAKAKARVVAKLHDHAIQIADDARHRVLRNRDPLRERPSRLASSISAINNPDGADVWATAGHAAFVEFGTSRMPAEPFLGPSFDEHVAALAVDLDLNDKG